MRTLYLALALFISISVHAQTLQPVPDSLVEAMCGTRQLVSGPAVTQVAGIFNKLVPNPTNIVVAVTHSWQVNAWEFDVGPEKHLICIPLGLIRVLGPYEGQLAFLIAHEIGHATDKRCQTATERAKISAESRTGAVSALLFGQSDGRERSDQRACETRADDIGFDLVTRAGYDPRDPEAAFHTLNPYWHRSSEGALSRLTVLNHDHPLTRDRIRRLHNRAEQQSKKENR